MTSADQINSLTEARARLEGLSGRELELARLQLGVLEHLRACQVARDTGMSAQCDRIEGMVGGVANPARPYLTWSCCSIHNMLKEHRAALAAEALRLGVPTDWDVSRVIHE